MNSLTKKKEISQVMASEALKKMLVGAYLDCFIVSSIQISLRFINAIALPEKALFVDISFSCEAGMDKAENLITDLSVEDFFVRRSMFLADVYACIGMEVKNINLHIDGSLSIYIGDLSINMWLSQEDKGQDESVWSVEMEIPSVHALSEKNSILCVPTDERVIFLY